MNRFATVRLEEPGDDGRWTAALLSVEPAPDVARAEAAGGRAAAQPGGGPVGEPA